MDKSYRSSSADSTITSNSSTSSANNNNNNNNNRDTDQYLRHLNKISHTISKPIRRPPPPPPPPPPFDHHQPPHQHQPPVYNINKSEFRDVVQKLTGSPAHERFTTPPPIQPPKPPSSRLQRIRPPPLPQLINRPPPLLNNAVRPQPPSPTATAGNFGGNQSHMGPVSPLPPFPAVHAAAESPISAYMRYFQTSVVDSDSKRFSGLSPRWNNLAPPQPPPPPSPTFLVPSSPLPFGCSPSPKSPYPLLSPSLLFSPATSGQFGFPQFPLSPTMPVPSPRWRDP